MAQQNEELKELQIRKLLLDGFSSNLNNHGRLIIGLSIILLTLFDIKVGLKTISSSQFAVLYTSIFLAALVFWFLLMRTLVYGALINAVYHSRQSGQGDIYVRIWTGIAEHVLDRNFFRVIPSRLFCSAHIGEVTENQILLWRIVGVFVCAIFAIVTTFFAWILLG